MLDFPTSISLLFLVLKGFAAYIQAKHTWILFFYGFYVLLLLAARLGPVGWWLPFTSCVKQVEYIHFKLKYDSDLSSSAATVAQL